MAVSLEGISDSNQILEFQGTMDRYNGVTIDSSKEACDTKTFAEKLSVSLIKWQEQKIRGVWFKVALQHAEWVPILAKHEFWFHHARPEAVMMCRWLPEASETCNIPSYCHTMVGVGGLVSDSQGRILVVKEKFWQRPSWKLPGGYLENGEDISVAAMREVLEETGIKTQFKSLVAFRHSHASQFNCSDIYLIVHLQPEDETQPINKCEREIAECCWMKSEEFLQHPEVHALNRLVVSTFLDNMKSGVSMPATYLPHPFIKDTKKLFLQNLFTRKKMTTDAGRLFRGIPDRFNGILVDSLKEPCSSIEHFTAKLTASLTAWREQKIRGVWFRVALESSDWVPVLAKHEFWFHHARRESVMMCRWLPEATEECNIPSYAHTMLSVGGLVTDSQGRLLVVKEKFWKIPNWKLPGGYVEKREDVAAAAVREVFEETGLRVCFNSLVGFLHSHTSQFGCSDIYLITHLTPEDESQQIKKCDREIEDCCWMKIEDYLQHREVHKMNKMLVTKFMEIKKQPVAMLGKQVPHPIFSDKQVTIFHLDISPPSNL